MPFSLAIPDKPFQSNAAEYVKLFCIKLVFGFPSLQLLLLLRKSYRSLVLNMLVKDDGNVPFLTLSMKIVLLLLYLCFKGSQFNSFKTSSLLTSYVLPVIILAALFCNFCNLSIKYSQQLSQTKLQQSKCDSTTA